MGVVEGGEGVGEEEWLPWLREVGRKEWKSVGMNGKCEGRCFFIEMIRVFR